MTAIARRASPFRFHPGACVVRADNPRQRGRVVAVFASRTVRVRWSNGWLEDCDIADLARA